MAHKLGWLVEDYGAVGNGATDDAPAFAALITGMKTRTVANGQQHVSLRSKVYRVNSPIVLDASGLQIHGHNRVGTVIEAGPSFPSGSPLIDVKSSDGNTQISDVQIGNLTLRRVTANGPLVRFGGCLNATLANCILGACNTYVTIYKPGSAINLNILLTMLDCIGAPATGVDATSVDSLRVVQCKIKCAGAAANGIKITTGDSCSAEQVLFENCGNAALYLRTAVTNFLFLGGGRIGTMVHWIDDIAGCTGNVYGRRWTSDPPLGTWDMFGPIHEADGQPTGSFVSLTGSDSTGTGTFANPWRTISFGASQLSPGGTLWVRGGRYAGGITISASGTSGNPINIESYPGEIAIIDCSYLEFQAPGGWELDPGSPVETEVYRSLGTGYTVGTVGRGAFWVNDPAIGLTLSGMRPCSTLAQLRATTYTFIEPSYEYYGGPAFCFDGGRIYTRIQNLASPRNAGVPAEAIATGCGDIRNHPPSSGGFNPNNFVMYISDTGTNVTVTGSYINFRRLATYGGQYGIKITSGAHHITIERCRLWGAVHPVNNGAATHHNTLRWCDIASGFSPCFSWNEIHTVGVAEHPRMESKIYSLSGFDTDITVEANRVMACFDGITSIAAVTDNLVIKNNEIRFLFDDLAQFSSDIEGFEVAYNYIVGPGPGYNGGLPGSSAGTKWWHHNILEDRRAEFGWRLGMESHNGGGTAWRDSHVPFATHSVETDSLIPVKIYNNTILQRANNNAQGSRFQRIGGKTAGVHEVYNNIVIGYSCRCYIRDVTIGSTDQIFDNNLMYDMNGYTTNWATGWAGVDFASLAAMRASAQFTSSQAVYAPGFEANSKQGDPAIPAADIAVAWGTPDMDYRPASGGLAATGAKALASTGWPGATNDAYIGAVNPSASTGLGAVGIPPGTIIGP